MSWFLISFYIVLGFIALGKGADWLVGGGTVVARRFGVSTLVIGLTVVAWGTSLPEVVVSTGAAMDGSAAMALGNALGSNIANIALVLGACAVVLPAVLEGRLGHRESFWMLASLGSLWGLCADGALSRIDGVVLLVIFAVHTADVFRQARREAKAGKVDGNVKVLEHIGERAEHWFKHPFVETALGMVAIALGAWLVVRGARAGALRLDVSEYVISLTIVALGTSLPELAAGLGGALKGERDISLGNVVGSNVFNVLAVMGITAIVHPLDALLERGLGNELGAASIEEAFSAALGEVFPLTLAFSLFLVALPFIGGARFGRLKGALLLVIYAAYSLRLYFAA
jgi:cation:H+ antiporter